LEDAARVLVACQNQSNLFRAMVLLGTASHMISLERRKIKMLATEK